MVQKILITGGCGFVGSNLAIYLKNDFPKLEITCFDNLKRRGSELNIQRLKENEITFIHGDVRNIEDFNEVGEIDLLIEAAAEPSVLSGIDSPPNYVLDTNLSGTINCLNFALKNKAKFLFLSTSRIYPIAALSKIAYEVSNTRFTISPHQTMPGISQKGIAENFPLEGARSFYGTSKLSSELIIQEYGEFYSMDIIINRCGVLTGPWQMGKIDQGVAMLWLARHYWKKDLSYIGFGGEGKQVRDILHIHDLYELVKKQIENFEVFNQKIFNVGGGQDVSISLQELTTICEDITGNKINISQVAETRPADIPVYISDNTKIQTICDWKPQLAPTDVLASMYDWLLQNESLIKKLF